MSYNFLTKKTVVAYASEIEDFESDLLARLMFLTCTGRAGTRVQALAFLEEACA